jgi:hypothetical protein
MKNLLAISMCAAAAFLVAGCEEKSPTAPAPTAAPKTGGAVKGAAEAATAMKDKAVATAQSAYDSAKKTMDDLTAKAATVPAAAKPTVDARSPAPRRSSPLPRRPWAI